jgi:hypothetical protein
MAAIECYHIDLGTHEVLYAERALVESFCDGDSEREQFSNFVQYERLYGAERQPRMTPFAPILGYRPARKDRGRNAVRADVTRWLLADDRTAAMIRFV